MADWADGLITINQPEGKQADALAAYREAGGRGPAIQQVHVSWASDHRRALAAAHEQWREAIFGSDVGWELALPEEFEQVAAFVDAEQVAPFVFVSDSSAAHADWLDTQAQLGFDQVMLHQVGTEQRRFVETFAEHVLPRLGG